MSESVTEAFSRHIKILTGVFEVFDCLVNEKLYIVYIKRLRPCLNLQTDSILAKVFFIALLHLCKFTLFFFYKNIFYKNIEPEICEILRIL